MVSAIILALAIPFVRSSRERAAEHFFCITRAMAPSVRRSCRARRYHERMSSGIVLENRYAAAIIDAAWSNVMRRQDARLLSLDRIKELIMKDTFGPVTLKALLYAEPPRTRLQGDVESIFRCVAAYRRAIIASEHDLCRLVQRRIYAYTFTLRRSLPTNVDVTEFCTLLHRAIMNRALNIALRAAVDKSLHDDFLVNPDSRSTAHFGRLALADMLEHCLDSVNTDYEALLDSMNQLRDNKSHRSAEHARDHVPVIT